MVMTADFAPEVGRLDLIYVDVKSTPRVGDLVVAYKRFNANLEELPDYAIAGQQIDLMRITEWKVYQKLAQSVSAAKGGKAINLVGWEVHRIRAQLKMLSPNP
jgi:hypothetical protein